LAENDLVFFAQGFGMRVLSSTSSSSSWFLSMCSVGVFFFPGVDIIVPAESGSARSAGTLADNFFFFAPVLILPSCV
jgi:hypothetical protein